MRRRILFPTTSKTPMTVPFSRLSKPRNPLSRLNIYYLDFPSAFSFHYLIVNPLFSTLFNLFSCHVSHLSPFSIFTSMIDRALLSDPYRPFPISFNYAWHYSFHSSLCFSNFVFQRFCQFSCYAYV